MPAYYNNGGADDDGNGDSCACICVSLYKMIRSFRTHWAELIIMRRVLF